MIPRVRLATQDDTEQFLHLCHSLDAETSFMMLERGERASDPNEVRRQLPEFELSANSAVWLADLGTGECAGYLSATGGTFRRNRHSASIVTGVLSRHSGKGLGRRPFTELERWAPGAGISRIELTVMVHNERARHLYESVGFVVEGLRRNSLRVDGAFVDELLMAKLLPA